jgi:hypothetical protein
VSSLCWRVQSVRGVLEGLMSGEGLSWETPATVFVARDTRPHSGESGG